MTAHPHMPAGEYFSLDAVSSSLLRNLWKEEDIAAANFLTKNTVETDPMRFGHVVHGIVLEGKTTRDDFDFAEPCPVRKPTPAQLATFDEGRATPATFEQVISFAQWAKANEGRASFPDEDWERAWSVATAIRSHHIAGPLLDAMTHAELSIVGEEGVPDEYGGHLPGQTLPVKARIDALSYRAKRDIIDLKVYRAISRRAWARAVASEGLFIQCAQYLTLAQAAGLDVDGFVWIVAQPEPPFRVEVRRASVPLLSYAAAVRAELMAQLAAGPREEMEIESVGLPPWLTRKEETELESIAS